MLEYIYALKVCALSFGMSGPLPPEWIEPFERDLGCEVQQIELPEPTPMHSTEVMYSYFPKPPTPYAVVDTQRDDWLVDVLTLRANNVPVSFVMRPHFELGQNLAKAAQFYKRAEAAGAAPIVSAAQPYGPSIEFEANVYLGLGVTARGAYLKEGFLGHNLPPKLGFLLFNGRIPNGPENLLRPPRLTEAFGNRFVPFYPYRLAGGGVQSFDPIGFSEQTLRLQPYSVPKWGLRWKFMGLDVDSHADAAPPSRLLQTAASVLSQFIILRATMNERRTSPFVALTTYMAWLALAFVAIAAILIILSAWWEWLRGRI